MPETERSEGGLRACRSCGAVQSYPRPVCSACGAAKFDPVTLPLAGTVYSLSTIHRAPTQAVAAAVPYSVVLVRGLAGGLVLARAGAALAIGDAVLVTAEPRENGTVRLWAAPKERS